MSRSPWVIVAAVALALVMIGASVAIFGAGGSSPAAISSVPGATSQSTVGSAATSGAGSAVYTTVSTASVARDLTPSGVWDGALSIDAAKAATVSRVLASAEASGIPSSDLLPPNLYAPAAPTYETGGHIVPTYPYPSAPAPLGIGFYGLRNESGTLTGSIVNTTAIEGYFSTGDSAGLQTLYFDYDGMQTYGDQLNAVLQNVTLLGQGGNQMWTQNVVNYNSATSQLSFVLNIWNFSSSAISMSPNAIISPTTHTGGVYAARGPRISVSYPFTFALYLNSTVNYTFSNSAGSCLTYGCNEVYFNYSVWSGAGARIAFGTYNNVIFNSQAADHHVRLEPGSAQYSANGLAYNPYVNLPLDWEWDVGIGASSGAMNNVQYAHATLGLLYINESTGKWQEVPAAYNYGSETGEDGGGAYVGWTTVNGSPYATMTTGPSFLQGLWNISNVPSGVYPVNYGAVTPSNAFIAYAQGANVTNQSLYKVAPTFGWFTPGGEIGPNTYLSPGTYTVEVLLSDYEEQSVTIHVTSAGVALTNNLVKNTQVGVYTPLYAFNSEDLANLSVSGSGTAASPYIMPSDQPGSLSLAFGDVESYLFPVWMGIYLNDTNAYVNFNPPPSLNITYPSWSILDKVQTYFAPEAASVPYTNQLQMYFYHASNVTVAHGASIGGWFSNEEVRRGFNVIVNDGTNDLFYGDFFNVSSEGLEFLGGGTHDYVWGSTFFPFSDASAYPGISTPSIGLAVLQNGDWIYNNAFYTNGTATSSETSFRGVVLASYLNFWNDTGGYQSASNYRIINGFNLTGSILGQKIQGGNYWWNYGSVADPYGVPYVGRTASPTGPAPIGEGADYAPLTPYMPVALAATVPTALGVGLYPVTFTETGLASGATWTARLTGVPVSEPLRQATYTTNPSNSTVASATLVTSILYVPNGSYAFTVEAPSYVGSPPSGSVTVTGASAGVAVTFTGVTQVSVTASPSSALSASALVTFTVAVTVPAGPSPSGTATLYIATASGAVQGMYGVYVTSGHGSKLLIPGLLLPYGSTTLSYWVTFSGQSSPSGTLSFSTAAPTTLTLTASPSSPSPGQLVTFTVASNGYGVAVVLSAYSSSGALLGTYSVGLSATGTGSIVLLPGQLASTTVWQVSYGPVTSNSVTVGS